MKRRSGKDEKVAAKDSSGDKQPKTDDANSKTASGKKGAHDSKATAKKVEPEQAADTQEDLEGQLLRLRADFDNFRKRTARERDGLFRRANEDLMQELLPVLDHLDLALSNLLEQNVNGGVADGVRLISEQMLSVLGKFGLGTVEADGMLFDPDGHEAISHLPSPDVAENAVLEQVRRGYKLGDKLLRAAQVVVSSGPAKEQPGNDNQ